MSTPKIYSKNYLTPESILTVLSGITSKAYLLDRDRNSKWISQGQGTDGNVVTINVDFYEGSTPVPRTIDTFFMLNTNVKDLSFFYWNGTSMVNYLTVLGNTAANLVRNFTPVTTTRVYFELIRTQTPNQEKSIGELSIGALKLDLSAGPDQYDIKFREKAKELILGDGAMHQMVIRHSPNRTQKYEARVGFKYITQSLHDQLLALKEEGLPFIWHPEPVDRPQDLFYVHWTSPWKAKYVSSYKGAGFDVDLELKEV